MTWVFTRKAIRDYGWMVLVAGLLLFGFVIFFVFAVSSVQMEGRLDVMHTPWVRRLISSMIGEDIIENFTQTGMITFAFAHPAAWAMIIAFTLTTTSGLIAGEIDRGYFDLVVTLPISRARMYIVYSVFVATSLALLCTCVWLGACVGLQMLDNPDVNLWTLSVVAVHLYAATLFVAGIAMAASAVCNRRLTAAAICFVYVFYAFTLNIVEAFWPAVQKIGFTGYLHYYRPLPIARDGAWQWADMGTLIGAGIGFWLMGLIVFKQRDLPGA